MPRTKNAKNKPKSQDKKLYKIGQLAEEVGLSTRSIRYLDQLGLFPHMKRSAGKTRLFDEDDIALIREAIEIKNSLKTSFEDVIDIMLKKTKVSANDIAIVCHEQSQFSKESLNHLNVFKLETKQENKATKEAQTKSSLNDTSIEKLKKALEKKEISHVFIILNAHTYNFWQHDIEKLNCKNMNTYITTGSISSAVILAEQLAERILLQDSLEELKLLLKKQIPMLYQISYNTNCKAIIQNCDEKEALKKHSNIKQLLNFKPIFIHQNGKSKLSYCLASEKETQQTILKHLQSEIESRGNYCHRLLITSCLDTKSTQNIQSMIQAAFPDISIINRAMSNEESDEQGNDSLVVTIL